MPDSYTITQQLRDMDRATAKYLSLLAAQRQLSKSTLDFRDTWIKSHRTMFESQKNSTQLSITSLPPAAVPYETNTPAATRTAARAAFDEWITEARQASELTRTMFTASITAIGDGIAAQLVEGTYAWRDAWKAVLRQVIATAAEIAVVQGLMAVVTGGASAAGGGLLGGLASLFHQGGPVPRHHAGVLARDEHLAVLQRGEYVVRRSAVRAAGTETLERLNRTGQAPGGPTFHVNVAVQAGQTTDPRRLAAQIAEPLIEILRRESARHRKIL